VTASDAGLGDVRAEDAFDVVAMHRWLQSSLPDQREPPSVRQFGGGASNLTYLLEYPDRNLVLRRPPHGLKAASAHDMGREVRVQRALRPHYPLVPEIIAWCEDPEVIGSEFYVMAHVEGSVVRGDLDLNPQRTHDLATTIIQAFADLHALDPTALGLDELGRGPGYVDRQVRGWSDRYRKARTDDVPDAEDVMSWLAAQQPPDTSQRLIHGDWRLDNMVVDLSGPRVVGVLDWEMSTIGDPLMDLGASLAYWVQADDAEEFRALRRQPTHLPGMPTRDEVVAQYSRVTGMSIDNWQFYEVYGLFRLAVILQQIWARYQRGETTNPAFQGFGFAVTILVERARSRI
jgi:aminoglycoside phosphotransferase (APT) family kinase protein